MPGSWFSFVVLIMEAIMALWLKFMLVLVEKPRIRNVHETHAQENDQTDLDAQFEIEIPENHRGEDRKEDISGRVESFKRISLCISPYPKSQETYCWSNRQT